MSLEILLQEIDEKKKTLDKYRPLEIGVLNKLKENIDIEYSYNSNAIEGNTMTLRETALVLKDGQTIGGKTLNEHLEIINHRTAINYINEIFTKIEPINQCDICYIHSLILKGIDDLNAGKYRKGEVWISGSKKELPKPEKVNDLMDIFSKWLVTEQEEQTIHPVVLAADVHYRLVEIHPFIDGNGRTSRLLMNLVLLKYGYVIAIIENEKKKDYYLALEQADNGDLEPFRILVAEYVNKMLDVYIKSIGGK